MFQLEDDDEVSMALMTTGAYLHSENGQKLKRYDPDLYAKIEKLNMRLYKYSEENTLQQVIDNPSDLI